MSCNCLHFYSTFRWEIHYMHCSLFKMSISCATHLERTRAREKMSAVFIAVLIAIGSIQLVVSSVQYKASSLSFERYKRSPQGPTLTTGPPGPPPTNAGPGNASIPPPASSSLPTTTASTAVVTSPLPSSVATSASPVGPAPQTNAAATPLPYVCVPTGTCMTTTNPPSDTNSIDPRILTPSLSLCPPGQEPCYGGQPTGSQCGIRYVNVTNTADGPTTAGAYPWQAYIVNQTSFTGSGVLLDQYHVLTAAHKVNLNMNTPSNVRISMGVWDPTVLATAQNFTAARIILHPNFTADTLRNDIAVIRLSSPVALGFQTNIGTACLPTASQSFTGRSNCMVSGWGQTAFGANDAPTRTQRQATVPIVDYNTCRASMSQANLLGNNVDRFLDGQGEICAGGRDQIDACTQDGGAPLVCPDSTGRFSIAGLVIWGKRCGQPGVYGVYVNVPFYRTWIDQTITSLNAG